jgi:MFS family permease
VLHPNVKYSIYNAAAAAAAMSMIQPYIKKMAIEMGATNLQLGYLSSWPNLVSVVAVLGAAAAIARSRAKQRLIAGIFLLGRCAALGLAMVPWFPDPYRVWVLIGFWVLAVFPTMAGGTALQSFLADVFPGSDRGRVLASRQAWATVAGSAVALASGWMLDRLFSQPGGYQFMFLFSFLIAIVEIYYFLRIKVQPQPEGGEAATRQQAGLGTYLSVFKERPYLLFLLCSIPFHFTWQMAWPIFERFQVTDLGATNTLLSLITVANSGGAFFAYPIWAKCAERYGNGRMMTIAALWLATAPFLTSIVPSMEWLAAVNLFTGIGVAGVMLLLLNLLLDVSPAAGRPVYLAVHAALVSISGTVAPLVGVALMAVLPIREALALCTMFRFVSGAAFLLLIYYGPSRIHGSVTRSHST